MISDAYLRKVATGGEQGPGAWLPCDQAAMIASALLVARDYIRSLRNPMWGEGVPRCACGYVLRSMFSLKDTAEMWLAHEQECPTQRSLCEILPERAKEAT